MKCALLLVVLAAPAPIQEKIVPPQGMQPTWGTAVIKGGELELTEGVPVAVRMTEKRTRQVTVSGRVVPVIEEVAVLRYRLQQRTRRFTKARYYDTAGKEIDAGRAAKLLSRPTVVLVSSDGKPLDPYYLRTIKDGTLLVVPPVTTAPLPPGPPVRPRLVPDPPRDRRVP